MDDSYSDGKILFKKQTITEQERSELRSRRILGRTYKKMGEIL